MLMSVGVMERSDITQKSELIPKPEGLKGGRYYDLGISSSEQKLKGLDADFPSTKN